MVTAILLGCVLCPLLESDDPHDNTFRNGNDTESSVALVAMCVAATCALARAIAVIFQVFSKLKSRFSVCSAEPTAVFWDEPPSVPFVSNSPPALSPLRI